MSGYCDMMLSGVPDGLLQHLRKKKDYRTLTRPISLQLLGTHTASSPKSAASRSPGSPDTKYVSFSSVPLRSAKAIDLKVKMQQREERMEKALRDVKTAASVERRKILQEYAGSRSEWGKSFGKLFAFKDYAAQALRFRNRQKALKFEDVLSAPEARRILTTLKRSRRTIIVR